MNWNPLCEWCMLCFGLNISNCSNCLKLVFYLELMFNAYKEMFSNLGSMLPAPIANFFVVSPQYLLNIKWRVPVDFIIWSSYYFVIIFIFISLFIALFFHTLHGLQHWFWDDFILDISYRPSRGYVLTTIYIMSIVLYVFSILMGN